MQNVVDSRQHLLLPFHGCIEMFQVDANPDLAVFPEHLHQRHCVGSEIFYMMPKCSILSSSVCMAASIGMRIRCGVPTLYG